MLMTCGKINLITWDYSVVKFERVQLLKMGGPCYGSRYGQFLHFDEKITKWY